MKNQERAQLQRLQQFISYVALGHEHLRPRQLMLLVTILLPFMLPFIPPH